MTPSPKRDEIVDYLDEYLRVHEITDSSPNGLQVQGAAKVAKIAFAVDASKQTIQAAVRARADMLIVHHGLWWGRHEQIVGNMHARIAALIKGDLSLYAAHLPLDCHPEVGNNVELARLFDMTVEAWFGDYKGTPIGAIARPTGSISRDDLCQVMKTKLGAAPEMLAFGPSRVRLAGLLSGGGAMFAEEAARVGCDTLITGETSHSSYHMAKEAGVNLIFGGHYATETVGVRALERHLKKRFSVTTRFIDAPTGY
ncbi:MAG: Nif3-like dinuclear metal center hexameric protein [Gemmatimonadales bacterium]